MVFTRNDDALFRGTEVLIASPLYQLCGYVFGDGNGSIVESFFGDHGEWLGLILKHILFAVKLFCFSRIFW